MSARPFGLLQWMMALAFALVTTAATLGVLVAVLHTQVEASARVFVERDQLRLQQILDDDGVALQPHKAIEFAYTGTRERLLGVQTAAEGLQVPSTACDGKAHRGACLQARLQLLPAATGMVVRDNGLWLHVDEAHPQGTAGPVQLRETLHWQWAADGDAVVDDKLVPRRPQAPGALYRRRCHLDRCTSWHKVIDRVVGVRLLEHNLRIRQQLAVRGAAAKVVTYHVRLRGEAP